MIKALLNLYEGAIKALSRLYQGYIKVKGVDIEHRGRAGRGYVPYCAPTRLENSF